MADQVTIGQVAQQAIERLTAQGKTLASTLAEVSRISTDLQDQLRELLSYCESQALEESAYRDVASKLRGILDGE